MLGVKSTREPLQGEIAKRFIEMIMRMESGNLNEEDRKIRDFQRQKPQHNIVFA